MFKLAIKLANSPKNLRGVNMKCQDCEKRKGIIKFSEEPVFAMTHGFGTMVICRQCYIKRIESELRRIRKNLKHQKELLNSSSQTKPNYQK